MAALLGLWRVLLSVGRMAAWLVAKMVVVMVVLMESLSAVMMVENQVDEMAARKVQQMVTM